jgi:hypothetical protein
VDESERDLEAVFEGSFQVSIFQWGGFSLVEPRREPLSTHTAISHLVDIVPDIASREMMTTTGYQDDVLMRTFLLPAALADVPAICCDHFHSPGVPLMACITIPHWFFLFSPQRPALPQGIG